MISAWWLLLIVPCSAMFGFIMCALCAASSDSFSERFAENYAAELASEDKAK